MVGERSVERIDGRAPGPDGASAVLASGYPRPIAGVPPERNLNGISFAVANATGVLAAALARTPERRSAEAALDALRSGVTEV